MLKTIKKICIKTLLIGFFWTLLSGIFLIKSNVYAQVGKTTSTEQTKDSVTSKDASVTPTTPPSTLSQDIDNLFKILMRLCYILLWPLIFLAGMAMDNSMVYGAFLHMDAPLWQFWNIAKNFANFALGFLILRSILKSIFTFGAEGELKDSKTPLWAIKQALIAGILIQASRFLTSALVDLSTIATYSIGGMPITVMKSDPTLNQKKIKRIDSSMDLRTTDKMQAKDFQYWVSTNIIDPTTKATINIVVSRCNVTKIGDKKYIIGRELGDPMYANIWTTDAETKTINVSFWRDKYKTRNFCTLGGTIYAYNEFSDIFQTGGAIYTAGLSNKIKILAAGDMHFLIDCGLAIPVGEEIKDGTCADFKISDGKIIDIKKADITPNGDKINSSSVWESAGDVRYNSTAATTFGNIIAGSKWFVGPLVTIYSSLLNFAALTDGDDSISELSGIAIIRLLMAVGLLFPLLALAVVLLVRIVYLWVVIAASPLIILATMFFKDTDLLKDKEGSMFTFGIANIIKNIFAPVIIVFALSISLIFMTTLNEMLVPPTPITITSTSTAAEKKAADKAKAKEVENTQAREDFWIKNDYSATDKVKTTLFGLFTIETPKSRGIYAGNGLDRFSRMIVNFAGIGIMRFILFFAIKASGSIGGKVGKGIQDFGENVMKSTPIIPIPGKWWFASIGSMKTLSNLPEEKMNSIQRNQSEDMEEYVGTKFPSFKKDLEGGFDRKAGEYEAAEFNKYIANNDVQWLATYGKQQKFDILNDKGEIDQTKLNTFLKANENMIPIDDKKNGKFLETTGIASLRAQEASTTAFETELGKQTDLKDKVGLDNWLTGQNTNATKLDPKYSTTKTVGDKTYTITIGADKKFIAKPNT